MATSAAARDAALLRLLLRRASKWMRVRGQPPLIAAAKRI
jgi:hypothetical protein